LLLGNLRRYTADTSKRFATRRSEEGLKRSLRIARALPRYTSDLLQVMKRNRFRLPLPSGRESGWGAGARDSLSTVRPEDHARSDVAQGEVPRSGTSQSARPTPGAGGEGWTIRPRRGNGQGCPFLFARAGALSKSPAAPHRLVGRSPTSAKRGVPFLLVTF